LFLAKSLFTACKQKRGLFLKRREKERERERKRERKRERESLSAFYFLSNV